MLGEGAHVQHDKLRLTKHLGVDPLQDEVLFRFGIQGYQEGVIDIAIPIFMVSLVLRSLFNEQRFQFFVFFLTPDTWYLNNP
jgi:hypothetical protein